IEVGEIGILTLFTAVRGVPERACLLIDPRDLRHGAFAGRHLSLERAGVEVVEIELAPIVPLAGPEGFIGGPEDAETRWRLEVPSRFFPEHGADGTGFRVGD